MLMIKKQLKLLFSNRIAILAIIAAPLLLTYLYTLAGSGSNKTRLYTANKDNSSLSIQYVNMIKSHKDIEIINSTEDNIKKQLHENNIDAALVIDKGMKVKLLQNYESTDSQLLEPVLSGELTTLQNVNKDADDASLANKIINNVESSSSISIKDVPLNSKQKTQDITTSSLIGFLAMFIWFIVIQSFRTLISEQENGTVNRIISTPLSYSKYLLSKIAASYIFSLAVAIVALTIGKYVLKADFGDNLPAVFGAMAAYLVLLIGITMLYVPFIKKHNTFTIFGTVIMAFTGILGGSFFSIDEVAPNYMKIISKLTPEAWSIKVLKNVIFNNESFASQVLPIAAFVVIGLCFITISYFVSSSKIISVKEN